MSTSPSISVIICTYNRSADLRLVLESLAQAEKPSGEWEVMVVANACRDDTVACAQSFADRLPMRVLEVPEPGKVHALNRAIEAAAGNLLLMTDDDVLLDPQWMTAYQAAASRHPEAAFFGGPVHGAPNDAMPQWYVDNEEWLRANPRIDLGPEEVVFNQTGTARFIGANLAIRKFPPKSGQPIQYCADYGPVGEFGESGARKGAEEFDMQDRLMANGEHGIYVPRARVLHRDPANRLTRGYLRFYYTGHGRELVYRGKIPATSRMLWGAPAYLWKELVINRAQFILGTLQGNSGKWLRAEVNVASCQGQIQAFRALQRQGQAPAPMEPPSPPAQENSASP